MVRKIVCSAGLCLLVVLMWFEQVQAEVVRFPEDELARETVLPKFDQRVSVRDRNVITDSKFELGLYYGFNTTEPIYNQSKLGFNLGYHWSEESAIVVNYAQWMSGLNTLYTDGLSQSGGINAPNLDFNRIPKQNYSLYAHYEWKMFYGKISLTKDLVTNLSLYPIFGFGITGFEHKTYPGVDVGVGQKFYIGRSFAIRADFKLQFAQTLNPFLGGTPGVSRPSAVPSPGDFKDKWDLNTILDIGFSFLL